MRYHVRKLLRVTFFLIFLFITHLPVRAVNMTSDRYKIQFGTINSGGGKTTDKDNNTYTLTSTLGQAAAKQFESDGYIVKAGFQYIYSTVPFTFSISAVRADLGTILPNAPATSYIDLSVSYGGAGQYVVTAQEDGPLRTLEGIYIPNTLCDSGCTHTIAGPWTTVSKYGFGYNMNGTDIPADFIDTSYYRPFADASASEDPATIMQSSNITFEISPTPNPSYTPAPILTGTPKNLTHKSRLTFKANVSPLQQAGSYQTVIHFRATPSF